MTVLHPASFEVGFPVYDRSRPRRRTTVSAATILADVAARHGLTVAQLKGPSRTKEIARPRQEAMALIYATGRFSMPWIGQFLGGRDHTTILHGVRAHRERAALARSA